MIFLKGHRRLCGAKTIGRNRRLLQREDMAVTRPGRQLWSCWQVMGSGCHGLTVPAPIQAQSMWRPKLSTFLWWGSGEPGLLPCCWWEWEPVRPFYRGDSAASNKMTCVLVFWANSPSRDLPWRYISKIRKYMGTKLFIAVSFVIAKY